MTAPSVIHRRACHLCEAICGLEIEVAGTEILSIKGDKNDPLSRGHICPKAVALQDLHNDPDRLREPVQKLPNGEWETISWEQALDTTAQRLVDITAANGVDSLAIYMGNPAVHNYGMLTHQRTLFSHFRTRNRYSATSVDQLPHHLIGLWLYGHKLHVPIPDIDRTDYMLILGGNPVVSNGSMWTVPDVRQRIKDLKVRGGQLVVVDPRRSETAEMASQHYGIKPGTDVFLLAAIVNEILNQGLSDLGKLAGMVDGLKAVAAGVCDITPEFAQSHTGIAAADIRRIARDLAGAGAAICYGRMGISVQAYGALCQWLIQLINIATGNLDRPGGVLFTTPAVDQVANVGRGGFARKHSRVRGLPEFDHELPAVTLAEEITTQGEGQIRALFTGAGNPVLSTPNGRQLDDALASLEFMVSLDPYINETTRHADIILPPTSPLEHDHYDIAFHGNAMRNTARYNEPVFEPSDGALHDWQIFSELGRRVAELRGHEPAPSYTPAQVVDMGLQSGPYGISLAQLQESPSGIDLGPLQSRLPDFLHTPEQRISCDIPELMTELAKLVDVTPTDQGLLLIGRRDARSNNSWMHNYHRLVKGKPRCTLLMNPADLAERGLADGVEVNLSSRVGALRVVVQSDEKITQGVVCLPHGWGHNRTTGKQHIAEQHAGVSFNDIADELAVDPVSGNAVLNGIPVEVSA